MEVLPSASPSLTRRLTRRSPNSSGINLSLYGGATENELLLIAPYMYKYDPKKDNHVIDPNEDQNTKFLRQVRQSKGYEVDAFPGEEMNSPFMSLSLNCGCTTDDESVKQVSDFAIATINEDLEKNYKIVKLDNAVYTRTRGFLLTLTAEDEDKHADDPDRITRFRAMVYDPLGIPEEMRLMEYKKLLPTGDWELVAVLNTGATIIEESKVREAKLRALLKGNNSV